MNEKILKNKSKLLFGLVFICSLITCIVEFLTTKNMKMVCIVTETLVYTFQIYSYITLLNKPVVTVGLLTLTQVMSVLNSLAYGNSFNLALVNNGTILIISMIALIVQISLAKKQVLKDKGEDHKLSIVDYINFKRSPFNVGVVPQIIIWSMFITLIASVENGTVMTTLSTDVKSRLFAALSLVLPVVLILMLLTTSVMSYEFLVVYMIAHLYVIYTLFVIHQLNVSTVMFVILQDVTIVYSVIGYIKHKRMVKGNGKKN